MCLSSSYKNSKLVWFETLNSNPFSFQWLWSLQVISSQAQLFTMAIWVDWYLIGTKVFAPKLANYNQKWAFFKELKVDRKILSFIITSIESIYCFFFKRRQRLLSCFEKFGKLAIGFTKFIFEWITIT